MAQWDVHANPSPRARERIPYVVVLQSELLAELPTRLVVPLSRSEVQARALPERLTPRFEVAGETLTLKPHETGVVPTKALGRVVASLRHDASRLIDAIDTVISGV
jgi:toxin CcdB